ncbi:MAG: DUF924 domain-containing protein [Erythrobacter sp.]|nr:MAG: DUF924 domain-containing protein [Erythrobacter sp.]
MSGAQRRWAGELLHFWFHRLTPRAWFGGSAELDREIEKRFRPELEALFLMPPASFTATPAEALAAVLLFDQVPRNLFRGTPRAFATDPLACAITRQALDLGFDSALTGEQAQFLAMPLMHSEHIADQRLSLKVFRRINSGSNLAFARSHYRMIARFSRFPHRNKVLARRSTPAEKRAVEAGFAW